MNKSISHIGIAEKGLRFSERPVHQSRYVVREHLSGIFTGNPDVRLYTVVAPAGYGKSTAVRLALQEAADADLIRVWVPIEDGVENMEIFLHNFLRAVRVALPSFGEMLDPVVSSEHDIETIARELSLAFARIRPNIILVIDDYHNIEYAAPFVNDIVSAFVEKFPENVRMVIISRENPQLACLLRLHGRREVLKITEAELRFSTEETLQLLRTVYDDDEVDLPIAMDLVERTEGWVIGIVFIGELRRIRGGQPWSELLNSVEPGQEFFGEYFASEILSHLSEKECNAARLLAELGEWNEQEARILFGADLDTALYELCTGQRYALVMPADIRHSAYRFHTLLRQYLLEHIPLSAEDYIRIASLAEQTSRPKLLCHAAVLSSDWSRLARSLRKLCLSEDWNKYITLDELDHYLELIPPDVQTAEPAWWIAKIYYYLSKNRPAAAIEMQPPQEIFSPAEWNEYLNYLCKAYYITHEFKKVVALTEPYVMRLHAEPGFFPEDLSIVVRYCISSLELGQAADIHGIIEILLSKVTTEASSVQTYNVLFVALTFYFFCGDEERARYYGTKLMDVSRHLGGLYPSRASGTYGSMLKHFERYEEGVPYLRSAIEGAAQFWDILLLCKLYETLYEIFICLHDKEGSKEALEKYGEYLRESHSSWQLQLTGKRVQWMMLFASSKESFRELSGYIELVLKDKYSARSISCIAAGAVALGKQEWISSIHGMLEDKQSVRDFDLSVGRFYESMAQCLLQNEITDELYKRAQDCNEVLRKSLNVWNSIPTQAYFLFLGIQRLGKIGRDLLHAFDRQCTHLCWYAEKYWEECDKPTRAAIIEYLAKRIEHSHVASFFTRLIAKDPVSVKEAGAADILDTLLDCPAVRENELYSAVTVAIAHGYSKSLMEKFRRREPPPLRFQCFGTLEVMRDGEAMAIPAGPNSKIPSLLSYLIVHRDQHVRTEDILYDVFGGTSETALNNFYQVIRRLRLFLEPYLASATDSHLIRFDSKAATYQFITRPVDAIDIVQFNMAISAMRRLRDQDAAKEAERAVQLYKGDFLGNLRREDWTEEVSEQYRDDCIDALRILTKWYRRLRDWTKLSIYAERGFKMAPYDEEFCAAQLHFAAIDRDLMLFHETYKEHTKAVQEFLATEPSKIIRHLYLKLKNQL